MYQEDDSWPILERALGGISKLRVVKEFTNNFDQWTTRYQLQKQTRLKAIDVRTALKDLMQIGWVEEYQGRIKKYRINKENALAMEVLEFLRHLG